MKLLSVEQARSIWLFPFGDINPSGKYIVPISMKLVERYKFANVPNIVDSIKNDKGILFGTGVFVHGKRGEVTVDIGIYNDGIVGDTKADTDASEEFLHDVLQWMEKEFGLHYPENIRKQYSSKMHIETKKSLNSLNPKLSKFAKTLTQKSAIFGNIEYELGGLNFVTQQGNALAPPIFRFERSEKVPYSDNRYYSFAGLRTVEHLDLLNQLEMILS